MASTATKTAKRRSPELPLPAEVGRAVIDGKEFILFPSDEFADWYEDQMLAAIATERLNNERHLAMPAEEVFARQNAKRRKGKIAKG